MTTNSSTSYDEGSYKERIARNILTTTLNDDSFLAQIERDLSGLDVRYNAETRDYETIKLTEPLLNVEGIRRILLIVRRYIDKNVKLATLEKDEQRKFTTHLSSILLVELVDKQEEWSVKESDYDTILDLCTTSAYIALSRGLGGTENERVYTETTKQRLESYADQKQVISGGKTSIFGGEKQHE